MKRIAVDIGGTFTDCFVVYGDKYVESKALTTHQNLALGFNEALGYACDELGMDRRTLLAELDSVRYATTLATNALIERKGPRIGLLCTAGFGSVVPLSRGRGYGEGLDDMAKMNIPRAKRPDPLVSIPMIRTVRERMDYSGEVLMELDEEHVQHQLRALVDRGAEAIVVMLTNSVVNPVHELKVEEIFLEEYPGHMLGSIPILLSHQVAGRKGEYARATSTIIDAFLHQTMYHALGTLELNLRNSGYRKPMQIVHNSGGMARLNSTDALQTVHSGPVSGIAASAHLTTQSDLSKVVAADMGGTSFDIGLVVAGGIKFYAFNPVIDRWLVTIPMVHMVTLGAGGGSITSCDRLHKGVQIGPESAGSDPGPACYDRGGTRPTVTDADLILGYLDPENYANRRIKLNPKRSLMAFEDYLCDELDLGPIDAARRVRETVDADMASGIATELRLRGFDPSEFTLLVYGGNGPLHACGIANVLGVDRILAPPFSSVFAACGAANLNQMHIHEMSTYLVLFDANRKELLRDFDPINGFIAELEERGRDDLRRQGMPEDAVHHRLEFDMRYGNQRVETTVIAELDRLNSIHDVIKIIEQFHTSYGNRYGEGSQIPEAGVRINTIRVCSYVENDSVQFPNITQQEPASRTADPIGQRQCYMTGESEAVDTPFYDESCLKAGTVIPGPGIVTTRATTYLIEPGWRIEIGEQNAVWFFRNT